MQKNEEVKWIFGDDSLRKRVFLLNSTIQRTAFVFGFMTNYVASDTELIDAFLSAIQNNNQIESLTLVNFPYPEYIPRLSEIISTHSSISTFEFSGNMGEEGPRHFAKMIQNGNTLKSVRLSAGFYYRGIHSANGGQEFCEALAQNVTLQALNLELNSINGTEIGKALEVNRTLLTLNLSANHMSLHDANNLLMSLKKNSSLKTLDLSLNGLQFDIELLKSIKSLTTLKVFKAGFIESSEAFDTILCGMHEEHETHSENVVSLEEYDQINALMKRNLKLCNQPFFQNFMIFQWVFKEENSPFPLDLFYHMFNLVLALDEQTVLEVEVNETLFELESGSCELGMKI